MTTDLDTPVTSARTQFAQSATPMTWKRKARFWEKSGLITRRMKGLATSQWRKRKRSAAINQAKQGGLIQNAVNNSLKLSAQLQTEALDVTLLAVSAVWRVAPVTHAVRIKGIFARVLRLHKGRRSKLTSLRSATPEDHLAFAHARHLLRSADGSENAHLLRTHTSPMQIVAWCSTSSHP